MRVTALLTGMLLMSVSTLSALDHKALAERIVQQMRLEPGEKVLLLSHPGEFEPLIPLLRQAVARAGGVTGDKVWVRDGKLQ